MRVKTGELKARLSHYLRAVKESGEKIEVCVREEPVACLTPMDPRPTDPAAVREMEELRRQFAEVGLRLAADAHGRETLPTPTPSRAGDERTDVSSVELQRSERDW